jgi:diguanylate cyclase (GGDEF)-like protein
MADSTDVPGQASQAADLLEANELLVLAALRAECAAESALRQLGDLARVHQRDPLTGLPNRTTLLDRLQIALTMAQRHDMHAAVLFIDLDGFKHINDVLGHATGDEVLRSVARRIAKTLRLSDTVSRYGGDEFVVLLPEIRRASDAGRVAGAILRALMESPAPGEPVCPSASVGIAIFPRDGKDASALITRADAAMYQSKKRNRGGFQYYSSRTTLQDPERSTFDGYRSPSAEDDHLVPRHGQHITHLREANERLVLAALNAEESSASANDARSAQLDSLAIVAHELRNPLAPIRMAAALLEGAANNKATLSELQSTITRQTEHMNRLINDLLDGCRASTGTFALARSVIDLASVVEIAVETCQAAMAQRQHVLTVELPSAPALVKADPMRLTQVLTNLLDNACKYTPEGGRIVLSVTERLQWWEIVVADNGIGIPADVLPTIFRLFVQDPRAVAIHRSGLGVGLTVVHELVIAHGGTVEARSPGKDLGSSFTITLSKADAGQS